MQMLLYSQGSTKVSFIITSWSFQSLLTAVEIKKLKWVCASWVLQSMKMFVCPHLLSLSGLTFKKISSETIRRDPHVLADENSPESTPGWAFSHLSSELQETFQCIGFIYFALAQTYVLHSQRQLIYHFTHPQEKCQHKYEYLWKQNMKLSSQKALEGCRYVSKDAV